MQRINITMPEDLLQSLRSNIPKRSRSKFIASAVKEKLGKKANLRNQWIKSLKANRQFDKQILKDWSATEVEGWPD